MGTTIREKYTKKSPSTDRYFRLAFYQQEKYIAAAAVQRQKGTHMDENMEVETPEEGTEGGAVTAETGDGAGTVEETAGEKKQEAAEPARQSREENARYQAARKAGEAAAEKRGRERLGAALAKLGLSDPDGGAIDSLDGLEAYAEAARAARLKKTAEESGRSVEDLEEEEDAKEVVRQRKREREERDKAEAEQEKQNEWVRKDAAAFLKAHPDVDLAKLDGNAKFRKFCGSRYGREPLSELYDDWQEFVGEDAAEKAVGKSAAKADRSTGTGTGGATDGLTAAQQRELDEWNRSYPQMKMTAKEFLKR